MQPAVLVRLRPAGPWRFGPGDGGQNRVDTLFRSDRLFSAFTLAAQQLGWLPDWLEATAHSSSPALSLSSLFPFQADTLFVTPPATLWPPPQWLVTSTTPVFLNKVRWAMARFAPVPFVESILLGQKILADQWIADPESSCLLRRDRPSTPPFRTVIRTGAAVDRVTGLSFHPYTQSCVEFEPGAGLWFLVRFRDERASAEWTGRVRALVRLLGDSGFGGRRTAGWGQTHTPEWQEGQWPQQLFPKLGRLRDDSSGSHWLLSLFSPAPEDDIDWAKGDYSVVERRGASGKQARFIAEGSVLEARKSPVGAAVDVSESENGSHPVYRSGIALCLTLPALMQEIIQEAEAPGIPEIVEEPSDVDAPEPKACRDSVPEPEPTPEPAPEPTPESSPAPVSEPEPAPEPIREPLEEPSTEVLPGPDMPVHEQASVELPPGEGVAEAAGYEESARELPPPEAAPDEPLPQQEDPDAV